MEFNALTVLLDSIHASLVRKIESLRNEQAVEMSHINSNAAVFAKAVAEGNFSHVAVTETSRSGQIIGRMQKHIDALTETARAVEKASVQKTTTDALKRLLEELSLVGDEDTPVAAALAALDLAAFTSSKINKEATS